MRPARKQCFRVTPGKQTNKKVFLPTLAQEIAFFFERTPACSSANLHSSGETDVYSAKKGAVVECSITCPPLYSSLGCSVACLSINASTAVRSRGSPPLIRDGIYDSKVAQGGQICNANTYLQPVLKHLSKSAGNVEVYYLIYV